LREAQACGDETCGLAALLGGRPDSRHCSPISPATAPT
jgi:hypothetical protein